MVMDEVVVEGGGGGGGGGKGRGGEEEDKYNLSGESGRMIRCHANV